MSDNATGDISGGTPSPSTGVSNEGSSPAPESSTSQSPAVKPQKLDVGMGARPDSISADAAAINSETYGDDWWKQHGEAIFKHDRFKELNGFKKQYQESEPMVSFINNDLGGFDELQAFHRHFGPIWNHLSQQGENANTVWSKLVPVFNNMLSGKDPFEGVMSQAPQNPGEPSADFEDGDVDPQVTTLQNKIAELETQLGDHNKKFENQDQQKKREAVQRLQATRKTNYGEYVKMMTSKMTSDNIPGELTDYAGSLIVKNLIAHMPKNRRGQPINPLDMVSEEAFGNAWTKHVLPELAKAKKGLINSAKSTVETGGPTLPDTNGGTTPASNQPRPRQSTHEKAKRFASGIKNLSIG